MEQMYSKLYSSFRKGTDQGQRNLREAGGERASHVCKARLNKQASLFNSLVES